MAGREDREQRDQWDIVSGVGFTALLVAAGRAVQTNTKDGLVDDPYAERFVDRSRIEPPLPTRPGQRWPDGAADQHAVDAFWSALAGYQGVRSRFFDTGLAVAAARGAGQVVLLAAGLDTRAFRLRWPADTVVYEIDAARVLAFKDEALAEQQARPRCERRAVPVDLRDNWTGALREAGFDPTVPTAWLAEGLLAFLPASAEADLFATVDTLSAPGSTLLVEDFAPAMRVIAADATIASLGMPFGVDMAALPDHEPRTAPADRLAQAGWRVETHAAADLARGYGHPFAPGQELDSTLITARR